MKAGQTALGVGAVVLAAAYTLWSYATESDLAGMFIRHQTAINGRYGAGLTFVATLLTVVGIGLATLAVLTAIVNAAKARAVPPAEIAPAIRRARRRWVLPALAVLAASSAVVAMFTFDPDSIRDAFGAWSKILLVGFPMLPLSFAVVLEMLLPVSYVDGLVNELRRAEPPRDGDSPIWFVKVASREVSVPADVWDSLELEQRVGLVTTGGVLGLFLALTEPTSQQGPYR